MKKSILILSILSALSANATILKSGSLTCATLTHIEQLAKAAENNDQRGANYLVNKMLCSTIPKELPCTILNEIGIYKKIRIYIGNDSFEAWTFKNSTKEK